MEVIKEDRRRSVSKRLTFRIIRARIQKRGQTARQIAKEFGCTEDWIYHYCRNQGTSVTELRREAGFKKNGREKHLPCGLPEGCIKKCLTQCYLAPKCPAAAASGKVRGLPKPRDYTLRGEGAYDHRWKLGEENAKIVK